MRTAVKWQGGKWLRNGAGMGQLRWQSVNFTYTSPLICPLTGQPWVGANGQDHQLLFVITKPPNKRGKSHNVPATGGMRFCTARLFLSHRCAYEYFKNLSAFSFGKLYLFYDFFLP